MAQPMPWENDTIVSPMGGPLPSPPKPAPAPKTTWSTTTLPDGTPAQISSEGKVEPLPKMKGDGGKGDGNGVGRAMTANKRSELQDSLTSLKQFESDLAFLEESFSDNFDNQGLTTPREYLPGVASPTNQAYNQASDRLLPLVARALGFTSKQMDTPSEIERLKAYVPQNTDSDEAAQRKLTALRKMLEEQRGNITSQLGQIKDDDDAAVAPPVSGNAPPAGGPPPAGGGAPPPFSPGDPQMQTATGDTRTVADPETQKQMDAMLRQGASYAELNQFAVSRGMQPVNRQEYAAVRKFLRENPNYAGSLVNAQKYKPVTTFERTVTDLGDNPAGAYLVGAGQALTANTLDNLSGDPERARMAMDVVSARNPTSAAIGNVSGGVMGSLLGEAGLTRAGVSSGIVRGFLADTTIGGASGAGAADNGDRLTSAAESAFAQGAGGVAGNLGARGVARMIAPTGGNLSGLYAEGVRPTFGQRMVNANDGKGFTGTLGRAVNATEEALQSVPLVGAAIRGAREEARDQFQIGAFNQALREIGEELPKGTRVGTDPHKFAQTAFNRVYDKARSGMVAVADQELAKDLAALAPDINTLGPEASAKLTRIIDNSVSNKMATGSLAGKDFKEAMSDLGKHIARLRKSIMSEDQALADVLDGVKSGLDSAARRHSAPEAVELLDAADAGYAKLVRIEEAAKRRGGEAGTFSPAGFDSSVQKTSGGVRSKAYLRGDALMEDYAQAGRSLEDRMPNSGTGDRLMTVGGLGAGAAAFLNPQVAAVLGTIGALYMPGVRNLTKRAMAPGGPKQKAIADQLRKKARLVGAVSGASAAAALPAGTPSP